VRDWTPLGGALLEGAAVASWGTFESEVFAVHEDGQVWNRYWDGKAWHQWEPMGGTFVGTPAAAARDADRIDVFAIGSDGALRRRWWDGKEWVPWRAVEGAPRGARAVSCTWIGGELRVFLRDASGALWARALR
jgi:hypothetical protein